MCYEPAKSNETYQNYFGYLTNDDVEKQLKNDTAWALLKSLYPTLSKDVPTWAAYNSLLGNAAPITTVTMLPVINGSPTEWENLYTAIKDAKNVSNILFPDGKTIISFDLQLYIKAVKLQVKPDVKAGYVFRMGELHVVFCVLKVLGKMIDGSGLDQVFEEAGKFFCHPSFIDKALLCQLKRWILFYQLQKTFTLINDQTRHIKYQMFVSVSAWKL